MADRVTVGCAQHMRGPAATVALVVNDESRMFALSPEAARYFEPDLRPALAAGFDEGSVEVDAFRILARTKCLQGEPPRLYRRGT